MSSNLSGLQNKEKRIEVVPSFPACSKTGENCISTGCCQVSGHNRYCFSVYTENTGNESLVSHELELLNIVAARGAGLFACEQWDVFGDVS